MTLHRPRTSSGFTLLEVMIALAILASTLVVLLEIITNNIRATNHSKLMTAATFLARGKMTDIEDGILETGFIDNDDLDKGTFKDLGFPAFRWTTAVERIELPTDLKQKAQDQATDKTNDSSQTAKDPMSMLTGMMGGLMGTFLDPIRLGLQESVRRVTVTVSWDEVGRPNQTIDVMTYLTDPAKLDQSLTGGAGVGAGATGTGGGSGTTGTGTAATTTPPAGGLSSILGGGLKQQ
jgi:general secretion pathway protein I